MRREETEASPNPPTEAVDEFGDPKGSMHTLDEIFQKLEVIQRQINSHITQKKLWHWVVRYPKLGKVFISILYVFLTLYAYLFAFAAVSIIAVSFSVEDFRTEIGGTWPILAINLVYIFIAALFFY